MIHNQAHITNMRLEIPDANSTANFVTAAQSVVLPNLEMDITRISINQMASGIMPGSKMVYEPFRIRFLIDEYFKSYIELYQWMISVTDSRTFNSTAQLPGARPRSILVHILDNSKKDIVLTFKFNDPFPISLDDIEMSYIDDGNPALICNASFGYSTMSVVGVDDFEVLPKHETVGIGSGPRSHPFAK